MEFILAVFLLIVFAAMAGALALLPLVIAWQAGRYLWKMRGMARAQGVAE